MLLNPGLLSQRNLTAMLGLTSLDPTMPRLPLREPYFEGSPWEQLLRLYATGAGELAEGVRPGAAITPVEQNVINALDRVAGGVPRGVDVSDPANIAAQITRQLSGVPAPTPFPVKGGATAPVAPTPDVGEATDITRRAGQVAERLAAREPTERRAESLLLGTQPGEPLPEQMGALRQRLGPDWTSLTRSPAFQQYAAATDPLFSRALQRTREQIVAGLAPRLRGNVDTGTIQLLSRAMEPMLERRSAELTDVARDIQERRLGEQMGAMESGLPARGAEARMGLSEALARLGGGLRAGALSTVEPTLGAGRQLAEIGRIPGAEARATGETALRGAGLMADIARMPQRGAIDYAQLLGQLGGQQAGIGSEAARRGLEAWRMGTGIFDVMRGEPPEYAASQRQLIGPGLLDQLASQQQGTQNFLEQLMQRIRGPGQRLIEEMRERGSGGGGLGGIGIPGPGGERLVPPNVTGQQSGRLEAGDFDTSGWYDYGQPVDRGLGGGIYDWIDSYRGGGEGGAPPVVAPPVEDGRNDTGYRAPLGMPRGPVIGSQPRLLPPGDEFTAIGPPSTEEDYRFGPHVRQPLIPDVPFVGPPETETPRVGSRALDVGPGGLSVGPSGRQLADWERSGLTGQELARSIGFGPAGGRPVRDISEIAGPGDIIPIGRLDPEKLEEMRRRREQGDLSVGTGTTGQGVGYGAGTPFSGRLPGMPRPRRPIIGGMLGTAPTPSSGVAASPFGGLGGGMARTGAGFPLRAAESMTTPRGAAASLPRVQRGLGVTPQGQALGGGGRAEATFGQPLVGPDFWKPRPGLGETSSAWRMPLHAPPMEPELEEQFRRGIGFGAARGEPPAMVRPDASGRYGFAPQSNRTYRPRRLNSALGV